MWRPRPLASTGSSVSACSVHTVIAKAAGLTQILADGRLEGDEEADTHENIIQSQGLAHLPPGGDSQHVRPDRQYEDDGRRHESKHLSIVDVARNIRRTWRRRRLASSQRLHGERVKRKG